MSAANCPETPRQKMISMMYLVLTAMLALNVSIEILSGYSMVDGSLRQSIKIAEQRNLGLENQFADLAAKNPVKTAEWKEKVDRVIAESNALYSYVDTIKRNIIWLVDGKDAAGLESLTISDAGRGDLNITGQINQYTTSIDGVSYLPAGPELRKRLNAYTKYLLDDIVKDSTKRTSIEKTFETKDEKGVDGIIKWETAIFDNMPAIATLTQMSKIQNDIRNTEAEIIQYLISQIDAGDFRVNKIDAMAIANSNYVIRGGKYHAEIILAATDSTQELGIEINGAKIEKDEATGKYIYEVPASAVGKKEFKGNISMKKPDGTTVDYPFVSSYTVAEPSATISADLMNVFYAGYTNPVSVSVPGVAAGDVDISITNAKFVRTAKGWNVTPINVGQMSKVTVTALFDGKRVTVGSKDFRVKKLPDPLAKLAFEDAKKTPFKGGKLKKSDLVTAKKVIAELDDADLQVNYTVLSFALNYNDSMGNTLVETANGSDLTARQLGVFKSLTPGKTIYIANVQAKGPDGITRRLPPMDIALGN